MKEFIMKWGYWISAVLFLCIGLIIAGEALVDLAQHKQPVPLSEIAVWYIAGATMMILYKLDKKDDSDAKT